MIFTVSDVYQNDALENSGGRKFQSHSSPDYHILCSQLYIAEITGLSFPEPYKHGCAMM